METNFQMLKKLLEDFTPQEEGVLSKKEVIKIKTTLHLSEMDVLQLRNLRDFTVLYILKMQDKYRNDKDSEGNLEKLRQMSDITSGITCVIDHHLVGLGAVV